MHLDLLLLAMNQQEPPALEACFHAPGSHPNVIFDADGEFYCCSTEIRGGEDIESNY